MLWKVGTIGNIDALCILGILYVLDALGNLSTLDNLEYLGNYALCIMHCALRIVHYALSEKAFHPCALRASSSPLRPMRFSPYSGLVTCPMI